MFEAVARWPATSGDCTTGVQCLLSFTLTSPSASLLKHSNVTKHSSMSSSYYHAKKCLRSFTLPHCWNTQMSPAIQQCHNSIVLKNWMSLKPTSEFNPLSLPAVETLKCHCRPITNVTIPLSCKNLLLLKPSPEFHPSLFLYLFLLKHSNVTNRLISNCITKKGAQSEVIKKTILLQTG